ncbi:MAG: AAA family ATPase [Desulfuromonadales bacterium]
MKYTTARYCFASNPRFSSSYGNYMYSNYFGFNEKPFTLTPNPRFIYLSKNHKEAFAHLLYGINSHYGFIELIGEVGTGKTTVLRTLLDQLQEENYRTALIFNPCLTGVELLRSINREFGLNSTSEYASELLVELNGFLLAETSKGRTVVLVIDESQNLLPEVLEQLRLISNLETENDKLIQIILAGQPELEALLARPELRQLNQRIAVRYRLGPLRMDETRTYIRHRMEVAGETGGVSFSNNAIKAIHLFTSGTPRIINVLCDRALLIAFGDEHRRITVTVVARAIIELMNLTKVKKISMVCTGLICIALLLITLSLLVSGWMPGKRDPGTQNQVLKPALSAGSKK